MLGSELFEVGEEMEERVLWCCEEYVAVYMLTGMKGDEGGPEMIESPTKRERFTCGVDIRVMEWICEDCTKYRVGTPNSIYVSFAGSTCFWM